jgi:hypothetical protein
MVFRHPRQIDAPGQAAFQCSSRRAIGRDRIFGQRGRWIGDAPCQATRPKAGPQSLCLMAHRSLRDDAGSLCRARIGHRNLTVPAGWILTLPFRPASLPPRTASHPESAGSMRSSTMATGCNSGSTRTTSPCGPATATTGPTVSLVSRKRGGAPHHISHHRWRGRVRGPAGPRGAAMVKEWLTRGPRAR